MAWLAGICAALLLFVPAAAAADDFTPLPLPGAAATDPNAFNGFAASGDTWLVVVNGAVWTTTDQALTWRRLTVGGQSNGLMSVAPDGAFWLPVENGAGRVEMLSRVAPDGTVSNLKFPDGVRSPPAWDASGAMWVVGVNGPFRDPVMTAVRLDASGAEAERISAPAAGSGFAFIRFMGGTGYVADESEVFRLGDGKLTWISGPPEAKTEFVQVTMWPEALSGHDLLTFRALSRDNGRTFTLTARQQIGVYGDADLLVRFPFVGQPDSPVMRRCRPWLFCETGLIVPDGTAAMWQTKAGLIAASLDPDAPTGIVRGHSAPVSIHRGALPPPPTGPGAAPKGSRALMAALNRYRVAAGVPALQFDPAMSRAAFNHARYVVVHHVNLAGSNPHGESNGAAFTGVDPAARCAHEGGRCDAEDILGGRRPVETLISSFYHRLVAESPFTEIGGAATYKGVTVFDFNAQRAAIPLQPTGFPRGLYRGPRALLGVEVPNPLDLCKPLTFIPRPPSVPVVFEPPGREPSRPKNLTIEIREGADVSIDSVKLFRGRKRVPGCTQGIGAFIGQKPLRPHTRYTAKARWRPSPKAPFETYTWTFRTR